MRNGSGTYSAPSGSFNPATNGNSATAADWNTLLADLVAAMTQSVSADGQTPITGNFNMGNNKLTSLGAGNASGQSLAWQQLFSQGTEADLPSATTTDIGAQNTNFLRITGTTTITSFGTNYNGPRFLRFAGVLTLTHNATTLILPGAANIVTAAGDTAIVTPIPSGWQVVAYQRAALLDLPFLRDYIQPGTVTHGGTTLTFQPTQAASGDNSVMMTIATVFTKTGVAAAATWAPGTGAGMYADGATLPANTNLFAYMIQRPDTGATDYMVSNSAAWTPPGSGALSPYTKSRRLPLLLRTNGSGQFLTPITLPPAGQAWVTTYSLAGVSSLDIFWPSTNFGAMQVIGSEIYPGVSGQQLEMQLQNNGTALAGANDYFNSYFYKNASSLLVASSPAVSMLLVGSMSTASADYTACFNLIIGDISKTAKNITAKASSSYVDSSSSASFILENNCGYQGITSGVSAARTGIRIRTSSGSFNQGFITVIGMPK